MRDEIVLGARLEREEICASTSANVLESLGLGKMLERFFRVVPLDREGARHRRDRPDHVNSNQERTLGLDVPVPVPVPVPALVPAHPRAEDTGRLNSNGYELRSLGLLAGLRCR